MAEENKSGASQFELGKLFIDIGSKGLGSLVKGLNTLSAQFLLTKNAAAQAIKPIENMSQSAVSQIVNYDKLHSIMGIAIKDLQNYKIAAELIGIDPNLVFSQMKNVQQQILKIKAGLDTNGLQGLAILGIDPRTLDQNDPLGIIKKIGKELKVVDEATRTTVLGLLGWNEDLAYMFDRITVAMDKQNSKFNEKLKLNDKELNNLRDQQDAWNLLKTTWDSAQQKFISNQTWINGLLNKTVEWLNKIAPKLKILIDNFDAWANNPHPYLEQLFNTLGWAADKLLALVGIRDNRDYVKNLLQQGTSVNQASLQQLRYSTDFKTTERLREITAAQRQAFQDQHLGMFQEKMPASIENPAAFIPESTQTAIDKGYSFEIINNNDLDIQVIGENGEEIGNDIQDFVSNGTLVSINNANQITK